MIYVLTILTIALFAFTEHLLRAEKFDVYIVARTITVMFGLMWVYYIIVFFVNLLK